MFQGISELVLSNGSLIIIPFYIHGNMCKKLPGTLTKLILSVLTKVLYHLVNTDLF